MCWPLDKPRNRCYIGIAGLKGGRVNEKEQSKILKVRVSESRPETMLVRVRVIRSKPETKVIRVRVREGK